MRRSKLLFAGLGALLSTSTAFGTAFGAPRLVPWRTHELASRPGPWMVAGSIRVAGPSDVVGRAKAAFMAVRPEAQRLEWVATRVDRFHEGDRIVHFEQVHLGLPVLGASATVRTDAAGVTRLITSDIVESLPTSIQPTLRSEQASRSVQHMTVLPVRAEDAHLVIFRGAGDPTSARLAYVVTPQTIAGIPTVPVFVVDAHTGERLSARDHVVFAKARMYSSNPDQSQLSDLDLPMGASSSSAGALLENPFLKSMNCVDKKEVKKTNFGGLPLTLHVCSLVQDAVADTNGNFTYAPIDDLPNEEKKADSPSRVDPFSEVSMYYHVSRAYQFFRDLQGDPQAQIVADAPLPTVSNLMIPAGLMSFNLQLAADPNTPLDPFDNAFFSSVNSMGQIFKDLYGIETGSIWFGQGATRDYSYDGDVVYHEFTHAVVGNTLNLGGPGIDNYGFFDSEGAMNEGLADYFSSAITGDANVGEYASLGLAPGKKAIRTLDNKDKCPTNIAGEVHYDSTLFSGGLWTVRQSLADASTKRNYDRAIYKAMRSTAAKEKLGYQDFVQIVIETLKTDLPSAAAPLEVEMTSRGVLPACERIFDASNGPLNPLATSGLASVGFVGYGRQYLSSRNAIAPGAIQAKLDLKNASKVKVSFTERLDTTSSMFGASGKPFTAVVLVKFNAPVEWTTQAPIANNADLTLDGDKLATDGTSRSTEFDVPTSATSVYVQVANTGDQDGHYSSLSVTSTQVPGATTTRPDEPAAEEPASAAAAGEESSGCAVASAQPHPNAPRWAALFGLSALAAAILRRSRKRLDRSA